MRHSLLVTLLFFLSSCQVVLAAKHPYFSKHTAADKKLEQLLQAAKIQALEYQPADLSIELKNLKGAGKSLESYRGKVLLLGRWATWCGACKAELPSKVRLQQEIKNPRFAVVGISNEDAATINNFQKQAKFAYKDSLIDANSITEQFFPGGAIPVTVVIDAWGWILGIKKGGLAWHSPPVKALMNYLVSVAPSMDIFKDKAPPPKVAYKKQQRSSVGTTIAVPFTLRWSGEKDKYSRIDFRLPKNKHIEYVGLQLAGRQDHKAQNQQTYYLRFKTNKSGTFKLPSILLNYWPKDTEQHFQTKVGSLEFSVATTAAKTKNKKPFMLISLAALVFFAFIFVMVAKGQKSSDETSKQFKAEQEKLLQELEEAFQELKQVEYATNEDVIEICYRIQKKHIGAVSRELENLREDMKYGGAEVTPESSKQHIEETEKLLNSKLNAHRVQ